MEQQPLKYLVVLDFEATCDDRTKPAPQEVIEFPSVLLSVENLTIVDEFTSFVRPHHHPQLTPFCTELTGIRQEDVDPARPFPVVLQSHLDWLGSHDLSLAPSRQGVKYAFAICGDWDLGTMFPGQCRACVPMLQEIPPPYRQWVNVKRPFAQWKGIGRAPGMAGMLRELDLELKGRHHRGIDDCRNIASLICALMQRGQVFDITTQLPLSKYPPITLSLRHDGDCREVTLEKRDLSVLLGLACRAFRRRIARVFDGHEHELTSDEDLANLKPGAEIVAA